MVRASGRTSSSKPASKASVVPPVDVEPVDAAPAVEEETVAVVEAGEKTDAPKKAKKSDKPTMVEMVTEAIEKSGETRAGISRQHIKKYLLSQYGLQGNAVNTRISRAIDSGVQSGKFVLPKGPSGCVKLNNASKKQPARANAGKENKKPAPTTARTAAAAAKKAATAAKKAPLAPSGNSKRAAPKKATTASKKTTSSTTKAVKSAPTSSKKAPASKKAAPGSKAKSAPSSKASAAGATKPASKAKAAKPAKPVTEGSRKSARVSKA